MNVTITDVDQRYSLREQSFSNLLTLELPSGTRFQVRVDDDVVQAVLRESNGQAAQLPVSRPERQPEPTNGHASNSLELNPFEDAERLEELTEDTGPQETPVDWPPRKVEHHVESGTVEWETLPDTQLPPVIRRILRASKIPPTLTIQELDNLKLEISKKLASKPKAGQVDWDSGPKRRVESAQRRQIPMDEAGNPRPPGGITEMRSADETDPGEVRDEDGDEGVQQA